MTIEVIKNWTTEELSKLDGEHEAVAHKKGPKRPMDETGLD